MVGKTLLNTKEAMDILRCSRSTLHRMIRDGEIRATKVRGTNRIDSAELERYLAENMTQFDTT